MFKIYLENNQIQFLKIAPYLLQSNWYCETIHKGIKKYLLTLKNKQKEKFDIDIALEEGIDFHNNR